MPVLISTTCWVPVRADNASADWEAMSLEEDRPDTELVKGYVWTRCVISVDQNDHDLISQSEGKRGRPR